MTQLALCLDILKGNFFLKITSELEYTTNLSKLVLQGFSGFAGLAGPGLSLLQLSTHRLHFTGGQKNQSTYLSLKLHLKYIKIIKTIYTWIFQLTALLRPGPEHHSQPASQTAHPPATTGQQVRKNNQILSDICMQFIIVLEKV